MLSISRSREVAGPLIPLKNGPKYKGDPVQAGNQFFLNLPSSDTAGRLSIPCVLSSLYSLDTRARPQHCHHGEVRVLEELSSLCTHLRRLSGLVALRYELSQFSMDKELKLMLFDRI